MSNATQLYRFNEETDTWEPAETQPNRWITSANARLWIYGILVALAAVGATYGIITIEQGGVWLALGAAVLGVGNLLAAGNVSK